MSDHILFVSEQERNTFARKIGGPRAPHTVVYNGVTEPEFEPVALATDAADFLYIGMMRDLKGPDIFIDALVEAERLVGRPLSAVMVGDGDQRGEYVDQVARLGLSDRMRFHDPMPAREAFALARIVVVPSRAEAMPYIVIEALAAGKPMIASSVGGIPEIFAHAKNALVEPDPTRIAAKMAAAIADESAHAASMPARVDVEARFSAQAMSRRIEDVYRQALPAR